jgi:hypothetical protein
MLCICGVVLFIFMSASAPSLLANSSKHHSR